MKTYEAMFLLDPALSTDWPAAEAEVNRILERTSGKILGVKNWDERKLAYPIGKFKRGLYVLTYFETEADKITGLERDVQLSDKCLRVLVLRREDATPESVAKVLAAAPPPKTPARGDEWSGPRREGEGRGPMEPRGPVIEEIPDVAALDEIAE